jgi:hypothetical protein
MKTCFYFPTALKFGLIAYLQFVPLVSAQTLAPATPLFTPVRGDSGNQANRSVVIIPVVYKPQGNIGAQAAILAAVGGVNQQRLRYVGAALVGITTIMNNNDNDGRPATFTGGEGSNFAAGG